MTGRDNVMVCVLTAAALAGVAAACSKGPTGPTPLSTFTGAVPTRLTIEGPGGVPPGGTVRLTATAIFGDGSTRNVTEQSIWRSGSPGIVSFPAPGVAEGHQTGDTLVSAMFSSAVASTEVIVTPVGTFRLTGRIEEKDTPAAPVDNASVEVVDGPAAGLATTTAHDGRYRLYGVSGDIQIRVSRNGYHPHLEAVRVMDHQTWDAALALVTPRAQVGGTYTLTIAAASSCAGDLPEAVRTRRYTAELIQTGGKLLANLSEATFVRLRSGQGNRFQGTIEPEGIRFSLTEYESYYKGYGQPYADLAEEISSSLYLVVDGTGFVAMSPGGLTGTLNGSFQTFDGDPRWSPRRLARCRADNHAFVFSR